MMMKVLAFVVRRLRLLANELRNNMALPDMGVIISANRSLFLSRTHFHIFGLFFPLAVPRVSAAVSFVIDLYRSVNLTGQFVATTQTGNGFTVIPQSREHGDNGDIVMSAQQRPEVFDQELETLQR